MPPYRQQLSQTLSPAEIDRLKAELQQRLKGTLPQLLEHRLLSARRSD